MCSMSSHDYLMKYSGFQKPRHSSLCLIWFSFGKTALFLRCRDVIASHFTCQYVVALCLTCQDVTALCLRCQDVNALCFFVSKRDCIVLKISICDCIVFKMSRRECIVVFLCQGVTVLCLRCQEVAILGLYIFSYNKMELSGFQTSRGNWVWFQMSSICGMADLQKVPVFGVCWFSEIRKWMIWFQGDETRLYCGCTNLNL